jgi:2-dehydro-3-deoxy-D-arabinonate dehydratase
MALWRIRTAQGERLARGPVEAGPVELLREPSLDALLAAGTLDGEGDGPVPAGSVVLAPAAGQEVWAAGVTYAASRTARNEESGGHDFYDKVYDAERPELFFKAAPGRVRGPGAAIGVREDSGWDVPEPELALVVSAEARILGYTIGNDVSSRSIEGENPLYLPQAKVYDGACAIGPGIRLCCADDLRDLAIALEIHRSGAVAFAGQTRSSQIKRALEELAGYLFRELAFPHGAFLFTGTGIVPDETFTLQAGDVVRIDIGGLVLENPVS